MKGYPIQFNIYAESEQEAEEAKASIVSFIKQHARHGRAVTGRKITHAISNWEQNPIVKKQIIDYFK